MCIECLYAILPRPDQERPFQPRRHNLRILTFSYPAKRFPHFCNWLFKFQGETFGRSIFLIHQNPALRRGPKGTPMCILQCPQVLLIYTSMLQASQVTQSETIVFKVVTKGTLRFLYSSSRALVHLTLRRFFALRRSVNVAFRFNKIDLIL